MLQSRPSRRPERCGSDLLNGEVIIVEGSGDNVITPPIRRVGICEGDCEKYEDGGDGEARIEGCGGDVVVLHPPAEITVAD